MTPPVSPPPIEPDDKDWTWVLERACPDCGFDATRVRTADLTGLLEENTAGWQAALSMPGVRIRPEADVWSALEYACHVRDVHRLFDDRVQLMLDQHDPLFANWDQDETALADRYDLEDPASVAAELTAAADGVAATYRAISGEAWLRTGRRSNGSAFTVASLAAYHLHDVVHHLDDVGFDPRRATVAAYDGAAADYRAGTSALPEAVARFIDRFASALPTDARVLEIGSGGGRDARELESRGVSVRRTDVARGFVELLRLDGHEAEVVDPLTDDLADPSRPGTPYDGVWASACLVHVSRHELPVVLTRLAEVTTPGGMLHLAVKEGDGEVWSTHGNVGTPRRFVLWRAEALRAVVTDAGWEVVESDQSEGQRGETWLDVLARRAEAPR